jgi:hypothetical protein
MDTFRTLAATVAPDIKANLFEFFSHTHPTIAAKAEMRMYFSVCQRDQIGSLPASGRATAERTQAAWADAHNTAHPPD